MNRRQTCGAILAGLSAALGCAGAVDLHLVDGGADSQQGWREVTVGVFRPAAVRNQPALKSRHPLYLTLRMGNGSQSVIVATLDEADGDGLGYTRLFVDANGNGDLTDDRPVRAVCARQGRLTSVQVDPFNVMVHYADGHCRSLRLGLRVRGYRYGVAQELQWSAVCHLDQHVEGRVDLGERKNVLIGIYDAARAPAESNGCFDDYGVDRVRIDLNGDGRLDPTDEDFPLSRIISVDGRLWSLKTDDAGLRLAIAPCFASTGAIVFNGVFSGGAVELVATNGCAFRHDFSKGARLVVPAGEYLAVNARVTLADGTGQVWDAAFSVPTPLKASGGSETVFAFGAPFRLDPVIEGEPRLGSGICMTAGLTGIGGEVYDNISRVKTRMEPRISITDSENVLILEEKMEYG